MNKKLISLSFFFVLAGLTLSAQNKDRWDITPEGSIRWQIKEDIPHYDHLEMSGQRLSVVLRYGVDADRAFHLNRSLVFPMLRMQPNKTQNNLKQRFEVNIPAMVTIDDQTLLNERVSDITFNGISTINSGFLGSIVRHLPLRNTHCNRVFSGIGKRILLTIIVIIG